METTKQTDIQSDEIFWESMNRSEVFMTMSEVILTDKRDLIDALFDRAYSLIDRGIKLRREAWRHLETLNPGLDMCGLEANHVDRTILRRPQ